MIDHFSLPRHRIANAQSRYAVVAVLMIAPVAAAEAQDGSLLHRPAPAAAAERVISAAPASNGEVRQAAAVGDPAALLPLAAPDPAPRAPAGYPPSSYQPQGIPLSGASWTYVPPADVRTYRKNDIVTIRVDELSRLQAEGNSEKRRNALYDALLKDWITLDGLDVRPAPQSNGDPRVQGNLNQLYRADASIESRESLSFNIAARIVDVRPNGDLVLEARKMIEVNDDMWETALSGICRPIDIGPDNVVLSRDLLHLQINKQDRGQLRDGYRRGWFTRWFETLSPF